MRNDEPASRPHTAAPLGQDGTASDGTGRHGDDTGSTTTADNLPSRLRATFERRVGAGERALLLSWASFGVTFGTARAVTHYLRWRGGGGGGSGGIVIGGKHLHHYNLGILLLAAVGGVAVHGEEARRRHPVTAAAYGAGTALVLDELALLLDLQDVYWAKQGRLSVDAAFGAIATSGAYLAAAPFWHDAVREVVHTRPRE